MEEQLIEAIKDHSCLFNRSSSLFRNKVAKAKAWQNVARTVGISVEYCQQRWKSLRDRFVREVTGQTPKSTAAANESKRVSWCYFESMMFLKSHIAPRKTLSNSQWSQVQEESSSSSFLLTEMMSPGMSQSTPEKETMSPDTSQSATEEETMSPDVAEDESPPLKKIGGKRRRLDKNEERFDRLCGVVEEFVKSKTPNAQSSAQGPSPNAEYFVVLDSYLKKHTQQRQDQLKIEILNLVNRRTIGEIPNCVEVVRHSCLCGTDKYMLPN